SDSCIATTFCRPRDRCPVPTLQPVPLLLWRSGFLARVALRLELIQPQFGRCPNNLAFKAPFFGRHQLYKLVNRAGSFAFASRAQDIISWVDLATMAGVDGLARGGIDKPEISFHDGHALPYREQGPQQCTQAPTA